MALSGMVRVGTIKKPAKNVNINMIIMNLMVGSIGLAFNPLNGCAWCAGRNRKNTYPALPSSPLGRMNRTSKRTMKAITSL